ncbi:putative ABC transporter ATP-binding protein YxlF [Roseovarius litorisediminis]|uniref:Putative ABC transporter ATP-binding protein YxlF n=2 Tax=Roseovarius litorisediminis TaxID=1312363 RepID=A0A1Y5SNV2_9RHOB|nr:putative ABC transporter ATP-binding protein YxlF [Roseovarius litorisediminis]
MMDNPTHALIVENLGKRYGKMEVLKGIGITVAPGERVALLGHNGAGKSTLIKLILGLTHPSSGRISVAGHAPGSTAARTATAYLPEQVAFHKSLTGREQLTLFARLAGEHPKTVMPLLDRVGLGPAAQQRIGTWSKGMRQRLGLAQALLGHRHVALLDEPTSGLDPMSRHDLYAIIDEMAANGTAVLIASHALTELEARTDRIAIMRRGELVADDTLARLSARAALPTRIRLTAREGAADHVQAQLGGTRVNGCSVDLQCTTDQKMAQLSRISGLGEVVRDVEMAPPSLEDLYRHYCGEGM